jgi:protein O-mannosyl-transferase
MSVQSLTQKKQQGLKLKTRKGQMETIPATPKQIRNILSLLVATTFLAYLPVLNAEFVNWDDGDYVFNNNMIRSFGNLKDLITKPVQGNLHPLTMLSLAFNFAISGLEPWSYHLLNLLLHIINSVLVFQFIYKLTYQKLVVAVVCSFLFAIHPLHVESVAWVAERKDVLYTLFFILALSRYIDYIREGSNKAYWLSFAFFTLSILSKPAAVIFPVALFAFDILERRQWNLKLFMEKWIFFVVAFTHGLITYLAQFDAGATKTLFPLWQKMLFGCYGMMMYIVKLVLPVNLATYYAFPPINFSLPTEYFLAPFFVMALYAAFHYSMKKNREVAFGISFYVINLLLVLQFVTVGGAVMSDRYSYVPALGIFYIGGIWLHRYSKGDLKIANRVMIPVVLVLSVLTYFQASVWHSGATLWDQALKVAPSSRANINRGNLFAEDKNYDSALVCYNRAIDLNILDHEALNFRGNLFFNTQRYDQAYADYKAALKIRQTYETAWDNQGVIYLSRNQYDSALYNFNKAIELKPDFTAPYRNKGFALFQLKQYDEAIRSFEKFLEFKEENAEVLNLLGICYREKGNLNRSLDFINQAIRILQNGVFYEHRARTLLKMNRVEEARKDVLTAIEKNWAIDAELRNRVGLN